MPDYALVLIIYMLDILKLINPINLFVRLATCRFIKQHVAMRTFGQQTRLYDQAD